MKFIVCMFIILPKLGHIWSFSDVMAGPACLSWLSGAVFRQQPCTRHIKSGCEVGYYGGAVFIIYISVVLWLVFAVT